MVFEKVREIVAEQLGITRRKAKEYIPEDFIMILERAYKNRNDIER